MYVRSSKQIYRNRLEDYVPMYLLGSQLYPSTCMGYLKLLMFILGFVSDLGNNLLVLMLYSNITLYSIYQKDTRSIFLYVLHHFAEDFQLFFSSEGQAQRYAHARIIFKFISIIHTL